MLTSTQTRIPKFSKLDCIDTQPIPTANPACKFAYVGVGRIQVDEKSDSFFHSKLEKPVNSCFSRLGGF